jgi:large repetitive protein
LNDRHTRVMNLSSEVTKSRPDPSCLRELARILALLTPLFLIFGRAQAVCPVLTTGTTPSSVSGTFPNYTVFVSSAAANSAGGIYQYLQLYLQFCDPEAGNPVNVTVPSFLTVVSFTFPNQNSWQLELSYPANQSGSPFSGTITMQAGAIDITIAFTQDPNPCFGISIGSYPSLFPSIGNEVYIPLNLPSSPSEHVTGCNPLGSTSPSWVEEAGVFGCGTGACFLVDFLANTSSSARSGLINVASGRPLDMGQDFTPFSFSVNQAPVLVITTTDLPQATYSQPYTFSFGATGGSGSGYTWSTPASKPPSGFTLSPAGILSSTGNVTLTPGEYEFEVEVSDSLGDYALQDIALDVTGAGTLPSTVVIIPSANPSMVGDTVTFLVTVTGLPQAPPTGLIFLSESGPDGSGPIGSPLDVVDGQAGYWAYPFYPSGSYQISAFYTGDDNYAGQIATMNQIVNQYPTSILLTSSGPNPSVVNQPVTFTATLTLTSSQTPTGTVTFYANGAPLGAPQTVNSSTLQAILSQGFPTAGNYMVTAQYNGDPYNAQSPVSNAIQQGVFLNPRYATATTLGSRPNPSNVNQTVTFTATVTSASGPQPTGTVSFRQGANTLGTIAVANGVAVFTTSFSSAGTFTITAGYSGDPFNAPSTSTHISQVVQKATTITTIGSSGTPSDVGKSVTFKVTVTSSGGTVPNGETVSLTNNGAALATLSLNNGAASYTTASLTKGAHTIKASYAGDAAFASSNVTFTQMVDLWPSATALTSSLNPSTYGQSVTLTATVTSNSGTVPTGSVTFASNGVNIGNGTLNASGFATFATKTLAAGADSITAAYRGDSLTAASTSATVAQSVSQAATTTTITSSPHPSSQGEAVVFTAHVTSTTAVTGTVTFTSGSTVLGSAAVSSGKATLTYSTLPVGPDQVTATYPGSANLLPSSATLTQVVN